MALTDEQKKGMVADEIKRLVSLKVNDDAVTWSSFKTWIGNALKPDAINTIKANITTKGTEIEASGATEEQRGVDIQAIPTEL